MGRTFRSLFIFLALSIWLPLTGSPVRADEALRVAIFPFEFQAKESLDYLQDAIFVTIAGRLKGEEGIEVVEPRTLRAKLPSPEAGPIDEAVVRQIAKDIGAGYAIVGDLAKVGQLVNLNARLIRSGEPGTLLAVASQYRGLEAAMEGLGEFADRARKRLVLESAAPGVEEEPSGESTIASLYKDVVEGVKGKPPPPPKALQAFETLQTLPTLVRGVGVGDIDGDRSNEIVLMDQRTLWIYEQAGERLRLFRKIEGHRNDSFLTLDVADVNRNGFAEIIVSNLRGGVLYSFILEFEARRIRKVNDREKWFFRVIHRPSGEAVLVGQKMGISRRPEGEIYPFVWQDKRFVPENTPLVSKTIPVFSFTIGGLDSRGERRIVYLDNSQTLQVADGEGAYLWESAKKYGGSDIFYTYWAGGSDKMENRVYIPGRLLTRDLNGDGVPEVVVTRNRFKFSGLQKLRIYDRANLVFLTWRGIGLVENWTTPEIPGYISDYQIVDLDGDGREEVVMAAVSKRALSGKASSSLLVSELF